MGINASNNNRWPGYFPANFNQGGPRFDGSILNAVPSLNAVESGIATDIRESTKEVVKSQLENFNVMRDKVISALLTMSAALLMGAGALLAFTHGLTGYGAAIAALGLFAVGGPGAYIYYQASTKEKNEAKIDRIHNDATDLRLLKRIQEHQIRNQELIEMAPMGPNRGGLVRNQNQNGNQNNAVPVNF